MAGVLSTIAYKFSATPAAVLTELRYGSALPMENAPAMTLKKTYKENGQWRPAAVCSKQNDYGKNCAGRRLSGLHQLGSVVERHAVADVHQREHGAQSGRKHLVPLYGDRVAFLKRCDVS